jgi:hypothetical protein
MTDSDAGWLDCMNWAAVAIQVGQTRMSRPAAVVRYGWAAMVGMTGMYA